MSGADPQPGLTFSAPTARWFAEQFPAATPVQRAGWAVIGARQHALLVAPTGSGKTLAAFLAAIDRCLQLPCAAPPGVRVLYVSPLKALVHDIERNLRAPLVGIARHAAALSRPLRAVRVDVRTGDTPARERRQQARVPADILVTTPESLFLLLGSNARATLRTVQTVIVDEIHALAPTKRGAHLALSLERLAALAETDPQRVGLSATVCPLAEIAGFLGGDRPVETVDASEPPQLDLAVIAPAHDMERPAVPPLEPPPAAPQPATLSTIASGPLLAESFRRVPGAPATPPERGVWAELYPRLLAEIEANRTTILFVNSRGLCERLTSRLNELAGSELVQSHHGSVAHERRAAIEEALKAGRIKAIVATSSLELGIDMGAIDRVLQIASPGSVARGLQRVGRAGHRVGAPSSGRIYPKFRGELLECAVIAQRMLAAEIEPVRVPRNALDVLAQQIVAICAGQDASVAELLALVTRAGPYRRLSAGLLNTVLEMLAGQYASAELAELRPLLSWDRAGDRLHARRGAALTVRMNAGTIPDRGLYRVTLAGEGGGRRLGELDEEMVFETRPGENVLLGASTWRVEEITRDQVIVSPAPGEPGKLPFWRGDGPGRPLELGRAIGRCARRLVAQPAEQATRTLRDDYRLDPGAAANLLAYLHEQRQQTGVVPSDRTIVVERFRDELGDWRICILSPFGARVHAPWSMALRHALSTQRGLDTQILYTDDGIVLRLADGETLPALDDLLPDPECVEEQVTDELAQTALFAALFRENAARALLLPRRAPERRSPLWAQRLKAQQLLAAVRRYPDFPILLETYRQALTDVFDIAALRELLRAIQARRVRVHEVTTEAASPFARALVFAYVAAYLYEQDAPLAERRAQALSLDRALLGELLGQAELRELLDAAVLAELEAQLQCLVPERQARDADGLHDLLRRLGDLSVAELTERTVVAPQAALERLGRERRAVAVVIAGERRWIAAAEAGLYRDALGLVPPAGLPDAFLQPVADSLAVLCRRYARTHGPFTESEPAERYGLPAAALEPVLRVLAAEGVLVRGEIRPGGSLPEWCDAEVLRRLKRRTLARLRAAVAPVAAGTLGLFLPHWHALGCQRGGPERLLEVVAQLQGLALPWSTLCREVLPARVSGFTPEMLDLLAATGRVVWIGQGALGARDGRVALYRREQVSVLLRQPEDPDEGSSGRPDALQRTILSALERSGASFLFELEEAVRVGCSDLECADFQADFQAALWDLVWDGQISNDTFAPLQALGRPAGRRARRGAASGLAGGRWFRVATLRDPAAEPTARALATVHLLLERYGVVSREMVQAEAVPGGFGALYPVLAGLEDAGRIRRGYFVEGLSGAQFARPGAIERLRALPAEDAVSALDLRWLPAVDPANPWGALLPWPPVGAADSAGTRPRRVAGALVLLADGVPALWLAARGRRLLTFPEALVDPERRAAIFAELCELPRHRRGGSLLIERVDGQPVCDCAWRAELLAAGLTADERGLMIEAFR